jgi:hypothetical protein
MYLTWGSVLFLKVNSIHGKWFFLENKYIFEIFSYVIKNKLIFFSKSYKLKNNILKILTCFLNNRKHYIFKKTLIDIFFGNLLNLESYFLWYPISIVKLMYFLIILYELKHDMH